MIVEETTGVRGGGERTTLIEKMTGLWKEEVEEVELKVREVSRRLEDVEGIDLEVEKVEEKELKRGEIEWRVEEVVKVVEPRVEEEGVKGIIVEKVEGKGIEEGKRVDVV